MSTPAHMFKIIGGDGREYGPVDLTTIQQWIREGRLRGESRVWDSQTGAWTTASQIPELATMFVPPAAPAPPPVSVPPPPPPPFNIEPQAPPPPGLELAHTICQRGYEADISAWVRDGWKFYLKHLGTAMGICWTVFGIIFVCELLGIIPCLGALIRLCFAFVFQPPLVAGIYVALLFARRRNVDRIGLVFEPYSTSWLHTCLANLMTVLIGFAVCLPGIILMLIPLITRAVVFHEHEGLRVASPEKLGFVIGVESLGFLLALLPGIYVTISYVFALPLAADKLMTFWDAMETSRQVVSKHWFSILGLTIVIALINLLGALACCVGLIFTLPLGFCILTMAYDAIFTLQSAPKSDPAP